MQIQLANPRGFCAGVDRAIAIVEQALERYGAPVYVRHEVVHNKHVVERLRDLGAVFVEELNEIPDDALVIFSAHGVSKAVEDEASERGLRIFDATCPLVTKVHKEVLRFGSKQTEVVLIGHQGHPEVEGTMGRYQAAGVGAIYLVEDEADVAKLQVTDEANLAYVTQTTLSMDDTSRVIEALKHKFPQINGPKKDDICYATQNRQDAVRGLSSNCDVVFVVGSKNSSNSNRLKELSESQGVTAFLIDGPEDIDDQWLNGCKRIGVTAGASAPEVLVQGVVDYLQALGGSEVVETEGVKETIAFPLPSELRS